MTVVATDYLASTLDAATGELQAMARIVDREIGSVAKGFEGLAGHTDAILALAAAIVGCVENENIAAVLPKVQALGVAAKLFITERLRATAEILETVSTEVKLLAQLSEVADGQEAIALEIKVLSVLTNIEVARLGNVGAGFQYLARELADFSKSVIEDTQELISHMEARRIVIEETRRILLTELPRLRAELSRIEVDLGVSLIQVETSLTQLSQTPAQFRSSVEDIAQQIAGVVAAIQSNDITRQQMEHVQEAFTMISATMISALPAEDQNNSGNDFTLNNFSLNNAAQYAGLAIQVYQLRNVKETVAGWTTQIRTCLTGIVRVSTSDVTGIGPAVLAQEKKVSSQLARIELLERESQGYSEKIQQTRGGLSNLVQMVSEHLPRSKSIRDRLRLLAFNSIVEASHLGTRADVILAISKSIKEVSVAWTQITAQSEKTLQDILALEKQTNEVMEAFSQAGSEKLREAQAQTHIALDDLRNAAEFASGQTQQMKAGTDKMRSTIAELRLTGDRLDACFGRGDAVQSKIEYLRRQLEKDDPEVKAGYDHAEMERLFSSSYTTEIERDVLRAALAGKPLPKAQKILAGNSFELF